MARENTRVSWVWSSVKLPIPSLSIIRMFIGSPSGVCPFMGVPHTQSPFVHALIVGPTPKPDCLFNNILFNRYDFPVRYKPATVMTPIGAGIVLMKFEASSLTSYTNQLILKITLCILVINYKRESLFFEANHLIRYFLNLS